MSDTKSKQKAIETVAEVYGDDSIASDTKEHKVTVIGEMDPVKMAKKLRKMGTVELISVGPAKEEKEEKKKEKKEEKKDEKK